MTTPRKLAIFGATSAIAKAAARQAAADGAQLFLAARDAEQLKVMASDLSLRGAARVEIHAIDFDDHERLDAACAACLDALGSEHNSIIAFGTLPDQQRSQADLAEGSAALTTNFVSPSLLLLRLTRQLGEGAAVAVITSVAGDRGRQSNFIYGAAKGGLSRLVEGLAHQLAPRGIAMIDIRPGFVISPMTADFDQSGPLWSKPDKVAAIILKTLGRRRSGTVYAPSFWRLIMLVIRNLPRAIMHRTKL